MKKNSVIASLNINNYFPSGSTIGVAKIELTYKNEFMNLVTKDIAIAHCNQLIKKILELKAVFKQLSGCELSYKKNGRCRGNLYFNGDHPQQPDSLPDAIGDFWCDVITDGMGSYCKFDAETAAFLNMHPVIVHAKARAGEIQVGKLGKQ